MSASKEMASLMKLAEEQGWRIEQGNSSHYRWFSPNGGFVITSSTPSDHRAIMNIQRDLRRYGLILVKKNVRRKDRLK